jgi:hypothetical protein
VLLRVVNVTCNDFEEARFRGDVEFAEASFSTRFILYRKKVGN